MPDPFVNNAAAEDSNLGASISGAAAQVKDKLADLSRTAGNKIDENRQAAASGLQRAAVALHEKADDLPGVKTVSGLAHDAANRLNATADYVRDHKISGMMADVEAVVRRNPGPSLLTAAVIGFLAARALSRNEVRN